MSRRRKSRSRRSETTPHPPPVSEQAQLQFLLDLQRLLVEGRNTTTYKFALLHALADLAIERGGGHGPLRLPLDLLAAKFAALHWRQATPYPTRRASHVHVLKQINVAGSPDRGRDQASIIVILNGTPASGRGSLTQFRSDPEWSTLVQKVERLLKRDVLHRLQDVAGSRLRLIYDPDRARRTGEVTLYRVAAHSLRRFHGLVTDQVRGAWVRFIERNNPTVLGHRADLRAFLFGSEREKLKKYRNFLHELQEGRCFYCCRGIHDRSYTVVDHFVPWARYSVDFGHNFVAAHAKCNTAKRDYLAAEHHLASWIQRNHEHETELSRFFIKRGVAFDPLASRSIARWAYESAAQAGSLAWVAGNRLARLEGAWSQLLG